MSDCSLRSRGSRFEAAAFLSHSQTKSVSARSFVQDSGARSWALCFDCSLRSLRCSLGCRRLRRSWRNGRALFRHLLLQIGGANIENPPSSSSLAEERTPPLPPLTLLAPLAEAGAVRQPGSVRRRAIPDARSLRSARIKT